jgi:hypothetical protein
MIETLFATGNGMKARIQSAEGHSKERERAREKLQV